MQNAASNDDPRYLGAARYGELEALLSRARSGKFPNPLPEEKLAELRRFLHREARLLDAREYDAWFELLGEDFAYWVPSTRAQSALTGQVSVNFDDRRRLLDRIAYTQSGVQVAQTPASRTLRSVTNVEAWAGPGTALEASANVVLWEYRRGHTRAIPAAVHYELTARAGRFLIRSKVIDLLDCDEPQGNNSFIL